MNAKDARLAFALLKLRETEIKKALKKVAPLVDQEPGDRNTTKLGAARLGKVAMTDPETRPIVTDEARLLAWVQANRPDQIEQVPTVYPAFVTALLNDLAKGIAPTGANGEPADPHDVGLGLDSTTPQQRFYPEPGADELLDVVDPEDLPDVEGVDLGRLLGVRPARQYGAE